MSALVVAAVGGGADAAGPSALPASYRGVPVAIADAPWAASLVALGPRRTVVPGFESFCSAVVIGPRRVLTATHCVWPVDMSRVRVRVGSDDLIRRPGRLIPAERVWSPRVADPRILPDDDLAVVETAAPLSAPALRIARTPMRVGERVSSFGFGGDVRALNALMVQPLLLRLHSVAARCNFEDDPQAICTASARGGGTRRGDSGGPLVAVRGGVSQLVGVSAVVGGLSTFANPVAHRSFIAAPPSATIVPMSTRAARIVGTVEVGHKVRCTATFAPVVRDVITTWYIGTPLHVDPLALPRPDAAGRAFTLPANSAGKSLRCVVTAKSNEVFETQSHAYVATIQHSLRAPARW